MRRPGVGRILTWGQILINLHWTEGENGRMVNKGGGGREYLQSVPFPSFVCKYLPTNQRYELSSPEAWLKFADLCCPIEPGSDIKRPPILDFGRVPP